MPRYRLITPHGVYAPGTVLDTDLPAGQMFSLEWPTARRLAELGVVEPLEEPQMPPEETGWSEDAPRGAAPQGLPAVPSPSRAATHTSTRRPKEQQKR